MGDHLSAQQLEMKYTNTPADGTVISTRQLLEYITTNKNYNTVTPKL
jgi:hypothetical protein